MPAVLQVQSGKHKGKKIRLDRQEIVIGRGDEADIKIASAEISRQHCRIRIVDGRIIVSDLGSSNGTFLNTESIDGDQEMAPGADLHVGPMTFRLLIGGKKKPSGSVKPKTGEIDPASLKRPKKKKPSDDDVTAWLMEDVPNPTAGDADTSIISSSDIEAAKNASPLTGDFPKVTKKSTKQFDSIAQEAADIIARHLDTIEKS